jgi:hypothetical protein
MKKSVVLVLFMIPLISFSQTLSPEGVFCSGGNHLIEAYGQISWTLGDNQIRTYKNSTAVVTQGFLQTRITITEIKDIENFGNIRDLNVKIYPNPVVDHLQIEKESEINQKIIIDLVDLEGKKLYTNQMNPNEQKIFIDFNQFQGGVYLLKISTINQVLIKTYKVIYEN